MIHLNPHPVQRHHQWLLGPVLFFILVPASLTVAQDQTGNQNSDVAAERVGNQQRIAQIDAEAGPLAGRLQHVQQLIEEHNRQQPSRTDQAAVAAFNRRSDELNREKSDLIARLKALEAEQDRLKERNAAISTSIDSAVKGEQDEFDAMNQAWLRNQADLIRQRAESDRAWQLALLKSFRDTKVPLPEPPTSFNDLVPGDVILFEPESGWNALIPPVDYLYRVAEDLASGNVHAAIQRQSAPVSHALTFVKRTNGVLLFLDHTYEGSRMIDAHQLAIKYKNRTSYIARPVTVPDGRLLWSAAREAALQQKSHFGIGPGRRVCSDQVCVLITKSTAMDPDNHRLGPIDVTPGDFFDDKATGKYFIVSRLEQ